MRRLEKRERINIRLNYKNEMADFHKINTDRYRFYLANKNDECLGNKMKKWHQKAGQIVGKWLLATEIV